MEDEHPIVVIRRQLHECISQAIKHLPNYGESVPISWCVLIHVAAPNDEEDSIGPKEGLLGFNSNATGEMDAPPWVISGLLNGALDDYEDIFMDSSSADEDDDE